MGLNCALSLPSLPPLFFETESDKNVKRKHFAAVQTSHNVLLSEKFACGCFLLNDWANDDMQLVWANPDAGTLQAQFVVQIFCPEKKFVLRQTRLDEL